MVKHKKASKLLLLLGKYFGFSILCGWVCILFFLWTARVISNNYALKTGMDITIQTEYLLNVMCIFVGIFITIFVLILLLQKKFSYIIQISSIVEEMESGNLFQRIPIEGEDELSDLALSINHLAEAMSYNLNRSEQITQERFETIAVLSHDLRTPLTSVMSYLQFIRDGQYSNEDQLHLYAERAYDKANRIKEMSDSLFNSCVFDGNKTGMLEKVDGTIFFRNALSDAKSFLEDHGFKVSIVSLLDNYVFYLLIDHRKMSRLFENIISNIQKYADHQYPVEFKIQLKAQKVIFYQTNKIIEKNKKFIESHLIGLKSVEKSICEIGGSLSILEKDDFFTLEIQLPIC
ncbi:HAMP domain-containing sensor histidine kinase [Clostridium butyricum]|uniref:HAMP domain-containing sensor histidine kinase n=1 Tax=Clostridium butyricum TaxID=1492 RepID=UPI002ABDE69A|nr:HAMP domain-containing sensor histidine kinase [Clostridium butyricum]